VVEQHGAKSEAMHNDEQCVSYQLSLVTMNLEKADQYVWWIQIPTMEKTFGFQVKDLTNLLGRKRKRCTKQGYCLKNMLKNYLLLMCYKLQTIYRFIDLQLTRQTAFNFSYIASEGSTK